MARPRTVSFSPEEMIELGEEMIEWIIKNNPLHISQWYSIHKMFTDKQWDTFQQREEFIPYYEQALKIVGLQYLAKDSNVEPSLKQRWQRVYFRDVRKKEDEDSQDKLDRELEQKKKLADHEHNLKMNQINAQTENLVTLRQQIQDNLLSQK